MKQKVQYDAKKLNGLSIYHVNNQTVFYSSITKLAYVITSSNVQSFSTWQMRTSLSFMASCMLVFIQVNTFIAIGVGVAAYVISTLFFYKKFLAKLPVLATFEKPKGMNFFKKMAEIYNQRTLSTIAIILVMIAVFMSVSIQSGEYTGSNLLWAWIFIGISVTCAAITMYIKYLKGKFNL